MSLDEMGGRKFGLFGWTGSSDPSPYPLPPNCFNSWQMRCPSKASLIKAIKEKIVPPVSEEEFVSLFPHIRWRVEEILFLSHDIAYRMCLQISQPLELRRGFTSFTYSTYITLLHSLT